MLRALVRNAGALPRKYRLHAWRFLLQLPENADAHAWLKARGEHASWARLHEAYPLRDGRALCRLRSALSALAHWAPVCGEIDWLPSLVFPFTLIFEHDELVGFEAAMSVLVHWGQGWLATFPHPPVAALAAVERTLAKHDAAHV